MKKKTGKIEGGQDRITAEQLEVYVELGMKKDALSLARDCLKNKSINTKEFKAALTTVVTFRCRSKSWINLVESAHRRFRGRQQHSLRRSMLMFYSDLGNHEAAARFLPRRCDEISDAIFGLDSLMELGRFDAAERFALRCRRALNESNDPWQRGLVINSLAGYLGRIGKWDEAIQLWKSVCTHPGSVEFALPGIVAVHLARALQAVRSGLKALEVAEKEFATEPGLGGPKKARKHTEKIRKELRRLGERIKSVLPTKFGIDLPT